jgi:hypothetical protein
VSPPEDLQQVILFLHCSGQRLAMPKATKKKKEKAADFTKAKLKLGKGKQQPSNVVDTSFKARC